LAIAVDVLSIHYDPELWGPVDPSTFYPQRFAPEHKRNPLAFLAFGTGPRYCLGMKFALTELKMTLTKLLLNFEIRPNGELPDILELQETMFRQPKYEINVLFKKREIFF
jgi:cytochrome P450